MYLQTGGTNIYSTVITLIDICTLLERRIFWMHPIVLCIIHV